MTIFTCYFLPIRESIAWTFFFLLLISPSLGRGEPCTAPIQELSYEIVRTWPIDGSNHPADQPILVEFLTPEYSLEIPEQEVSILEFEELTLSPLPPGGVSYGFEVIRSRGGTTTYQPWNAPPWEPLHWDSLREESMLLVLFPINLDGTSALPANLDPGQNYTVSFTLESGGNSPVNTLHSFSFTATEPAEEPEIEFQDWSDSLLVDKGCNEVELTCSSEPPACETSCSWVGILPWIEWSTDFTDKDGLLDRPWKYILETEELQGSITTVQFPGDSFEHGPGITLYPNPELELEQSCATLRVTPIHSPAALSQEIVYGEVCTPIQLDRSMCENSGGPREEEGGEEGGTGEENPAEPDAQWGEEGEPNTEEDAPSTEGGASLSEFDTLDSITEENDGETLPIESIDEKALDLTQPGSADGCGCLISEKQKGSQGTQRALFFFMAMWGLLGFMKKSA